MPDRAEPASLPYKAAVARGGWYWLVPYLAIVLFALTMFALVGYIDKRDADERRAMVERDMQWADQTLRLHLTANQDFLVQLGRNLADGVLDYEDFQIRAAQHLANNPELSVVLWVDPKGKVQWVAPFEATEWVAGESLDPTQQDRLAEALRGGRPLYGSTYRNRQGAAYFDLTIPVQRWREDMGAIVGIYSTDGLLRHPVPTWFTEKYRLTLEDGEGKEVAANTAVRPTSKELAYRLTLEPPANGLSLRAIAYATDDAWSRTLPPLVIGALTLALIWSLALLRRDVQRRLQAEKERDRLFSLSLGLQCIATLEGKLRRVNPAFERVLGYPLGELRDKSLLDFVHPDDMALVVDMLRHLAEGAAQEFECRFHSANGQDKWLLWSINPVPEEKLLYAVAHDITDRKTAEQALTDEYAFRKAMEESVSTGLRAIDMEGRIIYVNPAFCRMLGWSEAELLGLKPPFPYWPPEHARQLATNIELTLAGQAPAKGFEQRVMRKNGERMDVRFYISPLIDANGKQTGWMGAMTDITEPKRVRGELERSQERFMAVLDGLDSAVYVADAKSDEILFGNRAFKSIFGFDAVGRNCWEVTEACRPPVGAFDCDLRLLSPEVLPRQLFDGEVQNSLSGRWYHLHDRAIRWVDGRVVRVQIGTDITERKQIEEVNLQQQKRLEQTSRLITMGEMASSLAHELNQPLAAIANYCMGCVKRMKGGAAKPEELLGAMEKASFQAERAGKIIRRMREFVKKSEPNRGQVLLGDIVEEALGFAEIEARKLGVNICVDLPPDLPPLFADRIMIEQVLLNLVKNGIEAMRDTLPAERRLTVSATLPDNHSLEVAVADRGHGLGSTTAEELFAPFYTTKPEGMGMGLPICRSIIEYHKGRLWADANPGGGTVFRFTLPLEE
ncbi:PAS domain-containing sensor histidine kinase [Azospira sp. I09]|uniref:PAS domain-containing sensor histidine kinase n=1 Tax=Azospira sp. I09 TaxID=1765049 RepID=UPI001260B87D|nr:PAS domain S-box protein [Azospira sp. I09]